MSRIITPECRLDYVQGLFQASAMEEGDEPTFSTVAVFSKEADLRELKRVAMAALKERFGGQLTKPEEVILDTQHGPANFVRSGSFSARLPWRDSPKWIEERGYPEGSTAMRVKSKFKPDIVTTVPDLNSPREDGGYDPLPLTDVSRVYSGVIAKLSVQIAKPYDMRGNKGVSFYLGNVQIIRDADRFYGAASAKDEFASDPENTANFAAAEVEAGSDGMADWMEG